MPKKQLTRRPKRKVVAPKECFFCVEKKTPWFDDVTALGKCVTERGKIVSRVKSGLCALHQRRMTTAVKYARHLGLMSFVERV